MTWMETLCGEGRAPSSAERIELGRQSCGALSLLLVSERRSNGENLISQHVHFLLGHFKSHRV